MEENRLTERQNGLLGSASCHQTGTERVAVWNRRHKHEHKLDKAIGEPLYSTFASTKSILGFSCFKKTAVLVFFVEMDFFCKKVNSIHFFHILQKHISYKWGLVLCTAHHKVQCSVSHYKCQVVQEELFPAFRVCLTLPHVNTQFVLLCLIPQWTVCSAFYMLSCWVK